ncbi:hypothetical protein KY366_00915 [Candidatus Woesearchaeota archaeon]|nr:hypothetical protein [Candidatus Woesearchaeota archaeon]
MSYSKAELMACIIARELKDDDIVAIGLHAELMLAAAMLAQKIYSPNLRIRHGLRVERGVELNPAAWTLNTDTKAHKLVEYHEEHDSILTIANSNNPNLICNTFFIGGIQIDRYGNTNLIGIRNKEGGFKVRGPGSIGTTSIAELAKKHYIFSLEHTRRVFVEKVDYVSAAGCDKGKEPELCITPLCIFDFRKGTARLRSIHHGHALQDVIENTGFEFLVDEVKETKLPTEQELTALREIDIDGVLKDLVK